METALKNVLVDSFWIMPATPKYKSCGIPYITSKNIKSRKIDFSDVRYIDEVDYNVISKNRPILENDILISMIGTLGEVAVVQKEDGRFYGQNMYLIRLDASKIVQKYFLNWMESNVVKQAILQQQNKSTQSYLKAEHIEGLRIKLPSIDEQNNIAATIEKINCLIDQRKQQLQKLDELVKARFVEMFGDVPVENYNVLKDLCAMITDGTHQPPNFVSDGIPFLFVSNVSGNKITYETNKFITEETYNELIKRTPIEIGDVLLSTVGSYGHPAVVESNRKFCFQRHIAYLKPKKDLINSKYLHSALLFEDVQRQIDERVKGIAQKTLNLSEVKTLRIPLPSLEDQDQFADFVEQINKSKLSVQKSLEKLETLKKALMQKYFG